MKIKYKMVKFLYLLSLLGMISIVVFICLTREKQEQTIKAETYQNITADWTLDREGTQPVDVKKLGEYMDAETGVLSMYYQLQEMAADTSLVYRSKDVYTRILIDDETIYKTSVYDAKLYNKSPGNLWNVLNINSKYSGKCMELQITMVYDTKAVVVDSILMGDKADIILGLFAENLFGIVVSLLLLLLGAVLVVVDFLPSYGRSKKHHGLWWVGIYAFLTGIWSLVETNMVQFCVDDMRIIQLIDNMVMMLATMPLILYLNTEYEILKNKVMHVLAYVSIGYTLLSAAVQYQGEKDLHHMLNWSLYILVITDFTMCIWSVFKFFGLKRERKPLLNCFFTFLGLCCCCSCTVFEVVRSLNVDRMDRAGVIRIGMLLLCVCFAIGSQIDTYKIVEQGLKYELISKLAYSDGLTGLGNRTAYLEQLEEFETNPKQISGLGIVYLDVNNLKLVNDNQGHEFGDELIKGAARIIEESFGAVGKSYRIGGDEFCVLLTGFNVEEQYEKAANKFKQLLEEANKIKSYICDVQIAHGFAVCKDINKKYIEEAIMVADTEMYKNKSMLKSNR